MALAERDLEQPPELARTTPAPARREVAAVLRWRAHRLQAAAPPNLAQAARFLPVLLHASFPTRGLDGDAPGVPDLRYRRRWTTLARAFGLPPPFRAQRGEPLATAVLALPARDALDAVVLVDRGLGPHDLGRVQERAEAAQAALASGGAPVRIAVFDAARLERDRETAHRALAFGALLAGRLTPATWSALEAATRGGPGARTLSALAARAPTPLATLALTLLVRDPGPGPLDVLARLLAAGEPARALSDPELFCVRWAGEVEPIRRPLERALALARRPAEEGDPREVLDLGRELSAACARAIRSARGGVDRWLRHLWHDAIGPGMPRVLLPALGERLARVLRAERLAPERAGRAWEVRLSDGSVLGRGAHAAQARGRALALAATALAARPGARPEPVGELLGEVDAAWRVALPHLGRRRERAALLVVVEAEGAQRAGPPFDLLNRGPDRAIEIDGALSVLCRPGRRPACRRLSPAETIRALLLPTAEGATPEVAAARPEARPAVARLAQLAAAIRDTRPADPVAVEAGGRVFLPRGRGLREWSLSRFALRPRAFAPDPAAPDISISHGELRAGHSRQPGLLQCRVSIGAGDRGWVLYADGRGGHLREPVLLEELEEHLDDARTIVRAAAPPAALALRLADEIDPARRRAQGPARVEVAVRGELPWPCVEIGGERFGGASPLGWHAAALALLATWPPGGEGRVAVRDVQVTAAGAPASPLQALWAASVVRRRLRTWLLRELASYRAARASRREG